MRRPSRLVPLFDQLVAFGLRQQGQGRDPLFGVRHGFPKQNLVVPQHPADRFLVEQCDIIFQLAMDLSLPFDDIARTTPFREARGPVGCRSPRRCDDPGLIEGGSRKAEQELEPRGLPVSPHTSSGADAPNAGLDTPTRRATAGAHSHRSHEIRDPRTGRHKTVEPSRPIPRDLPIGSMRRLPGQCRRRTVHRPNSDRGGRRRPRATSAACPPVSQKAAPTREPGQEATRATFRAVRSTAAGRGRSVGSDRKRGETCGIERLAIFSSGGKRCPIVCCGLLFHSRSYTCEQESTGRTALDNLWFGHGHGRAQARG